VTNTGEKRNVVCGWKTPGRFTLPGDTKVVTIKAHNDVGNVGGILASFSNRVVTNASWQCVDMSKSNPTWLSAIEYGLNVASSGSIWSENNKPGKKISEIEETAQWIWVRNSEARRVWCRKTFSK
jgi:hypothetical protein